VTIFLCLLMELKSPKFLETLAFLNNVFLSTIAIGLRVNSYLLL
jgi:hypothetical protein